MNPQTTISPFATERAKLERQLEILEQKRTAVASALEGVVEAERRLAALEVSEPGATGDVSPVAPKGGLRGEEPSKRFVVIARVLREAGRAMTVPEIAKEITRRGDTTSKKTLRDIIHAICRRKPDLFERLRQNGRVVWRLKSAVGPDNDGKDGGDGSAVNDAHRNGYADRAADLDQRKGGGDLANRTIKDAARIVLADHGNTPMHFSELADEMQRRGYRSGRVNPLRASSVATILNAQRDEFENMGGGLYRLIKT